MRKLSGASIYLFGDTLFSSSNLRISKVVLQNFRNLTIYDVTSMTLNEAKIVNNPGSVFALSESAVSNSVNGSIVNYGFLFMYGEKDIK